MKKYRVRYSVEMGEFDEPKNTPGDVRPMDGVRISAASPNYGYTDYLVVCSIIDPDDGTESLLWMIDPDLPNEIAAQLVESLKHHMEHHHASENLPDLGGRTTPKHKPAGATTPKFPRGAKYPPGTKT